MQWKKIPILILAVFCLGTIWGYDAMGHEAQRRRSVQSTAAADRLRAHVLSTGDERFGGVYLDEKKDIVVRIVSETEESDRAIRREYTKIAKSTNLIFRKAEFSYLRLQRTMDKLNALLRENAANPESVLSSVASMALYEDQNCISVRILFLDEEKRTRFTQEVMDAPEIRLDTTTGRPTLVSR